MDEQEALARMKGIARVQQGDPEACHGDADQLIGDFLVDQGFIELVEAYRVLLKGSWYA